MSSLAIYRHEHKKWSVFAVANTNHFLLLIFHVAFYDSFAASTSGTIGVQQILTASKASVKPGLWRWILRSGGKRSLGNPGPQIQSSDTLGPLVSMARGLQENWHRHSPDCTNEEWKSFVIGTVFQAEPCWVIYTLCSKTGNAGFKKRKWTKGIPSHLGCWTEMSVYWRPGGTKQNLQM